MLLRTSWPAISRISSVGLSLVLLAAITYGLSTRIDAKELLDITSRIDLRWLGVAILLMFAQIAVTVFRLRLVAEDVAGTPQPYSRYAAIQWLTLFINHGVPVAAIGEAARVAIIRSMLKLSLTNAFRVLVYDRLWGLLGMAVIGTIFSALQLIEDVDGSLVWSQFIVWAAVGGGFVLLAILRQYAGLVPWLRLRQLLLIAAGYFDSWHSLRRLLLQGVCAAWYIVLAAIVLWSIAQGLGLGLYFSAALLFSPIILFSMSLPFFYAGWGAREAVVVATLGHASNMSASGALALSFGYGVVYLIASLPGGGVWAVKSTKSRTHTDGWRE